MTTRVIVRRLVIRAGILLILTSLILVSFNAVTEQRLEGERQQYLSTIFGSVLVADRYESIDIESNDEVAPEIVSAFRALDSDGNILGYVIETRASASTGDIACISGFSADGETLLMLDVLSNEVSGMGVSSPGFLQQFTGAKLPMAIAADLPDETDPDEIYPPISGIADGVFRAEMEESDEAGYRDFVEIHVEGGRIVEVTWDALQADGGNNRAQASVNGEYKLEDNTTIWAAQAYAMQNKLIEVQDPAKIAIKASGTTDIVPGVYISVNAFLILANKCIEDSKNANPDGAPPVSGYDPNGASVDNGDVDDTDATDIDSDLPLEEDGVVRNSDKFDETIDGFPYVDIKTKILSAFGDEEQARAVVRSVNYAYRLVGDIVQGGNEG
jgi:major membrane immunogen (membrane-anchored lipoprotein)/Na+-translocating ferredoxin:NAD+ oxidoreductase RnfG subunit